MANNKRYKKNRRNAFIESYNRINFQSRLKVIKTWKWLSGCGILENWQIIGTCWKYKKSFAGNKKTRLHFDKNQCFNWKTVSALLRSLVQDRELRAFFFTVAGRCARCSAIISRVSARRKIVYQVATLFRLFGSFGCSRTIKIVI